MTSVPRPASSLGVVFLVNFVAPNLVEVFREVSEHVARFTVLVSVPMEPNRDWRPQHGELDVVVQRTISRRRRVEHPGGFVDDQYVHIPYDTLRQLRRLRPDVVMSLELGARSVFAAAHARRRAVAHVLCFFGSERTEAGVGRGRLALRRALVRRADIVTYNGPSARRYLVAVLGVDEQRVLPWNYAADPSKIHRGELMPCDDGQLRILTIGQLVARKGVEPAVRALTDFASAHPDLGVVWTVVGNGALRPLLEQPPRPDNLRIELVGHLGPDKISAMYAQHEVLLFPTLADEWGLVAEEALGSGLAVLGSKHSQSVETLVRNGENGFIFDPSRDDDIYQTLERWRGLTVDERMAMRRRARVSVAERTPRAAADQLVEAALSAVLRRDGRRSR